MTKATKIQNAPQKLRQGDVFIERIERVPSNLTEVPRSKRGVVLAEGEVTGHAHRIPSRFAKLFRDESDQRFLRVTAPVYLGHEEHKTVCAEPDCDALAMFVKAPFVEANYRCSIHQQPNMLKMKEPGTTAIPPGEYRVHIHAEYQPGELPRTVAD